MIKLFLLVKSSIKISKIPTNITKFYEGYSKRIEFNINLIKFIINNFQDRSLLFESGSERVTVENKFKEFN